MERPPEDRPAVPAELILFRVRHWQGSVLPAVEASSAKMTVSGMVGGLDWQPMSRAVLHRTDSRDVWIKVISYCVEQESLTELKNTAAINAKLRAMHAERRDISRRVVARAFNKEIQEWERRLKEGDIPWEQIVIRVDGASRSFETMSFGNRWIAVGRVDPVDLIIDAQGVSYESVALERLDPSL